MRGDKAIAELRPVPVAMRLDELPAFMASLLHLSEAEAADFAEDLSEACEQLAHKGTPDPWGSESTPVS